MQILNWGRRLTKEVVGKTPRNAIKLDLAKWERDGYYVLPGFYEPEQIDEILQAQSLAWKSQAPRIVVDDLMTGERLKLADVSGHARQAHRFKVNDLFLESAVIRSAGLNQKLTPILRTLLGHTPVLCNSLSFQQGSNQPDHVDALYMTPQTNGHLIAIWIALEDCHPDAGPLRYFPGSHRIPPYVFSNGLHHFVPDEMSEWESYMQSQVRALGLEPTVFPARKGDVFVWSCYLLHGGSPIVDTTLTRKSLVFHYYSEHDARRTNSHIIPDSGGFWLHRAHQPVGEAPGEFPPL